MQLKLWIEERMVTEMRQGDIKMASLGQQVEDLINNVKANELRADGQEAEVSLFCLPAILQLPLVMTLSTI